MQKSHRPKIGTLGKQKFWSIGEKKHKKNTQTFRWCITLLWTVFLWLFFISLSTSTTILLWWRNEMATELYRFLHCFHITCYKCYKFLLIYFTCRTQNTEFNESAVTCSMCRRAERLACGQRPSEMRWGCAVSTELVVLLLELRVGISRFDGGIDNLDKIPPYSPPPPSRQDHRKAA